MKFQHSEGRKGTGFVFMAILTSLLSTVVFVRFAYAVGVLGFAGSLITIVAGLLVVIPSSLSVMRFSSFKKQNGAVFFHELGPGAGTVIGLVLFAALTLNGALYVVALTEVFTPFITRFELSEPMWRSILGASITLLLSYFILRRKLFSLNYLVTSIVFIALLFGILFLILGNTPIHDHGITRFSWQMVNLKSSFFNVFAVVFPSFTGIFSGVLAVSERRSAGARTGAALLFAIISGSLILTMIAYKLSISALPNDLAADHLIMGKIAFNGAAVIPVLIAITSVFGAHLSIIAASGIYYGLADGNHIPLDVLNKLVGRGKSVQDKKFNAALLTCILAFFFALNYNFDLLARIVSALFVTATGVICLASFFYSFNLDPFKKIYINIPWYLNLAGFICSMWFLFGIQAYFALLIISIVVVLFLIILSRYPGVNDFLKLTGYTVDRLRRNFNNFPVHDESRPVSMLCISKYTFEDDKALLMLEQITGSAGFGTYIHVIEGNLTDTDSSLVAEYKKKLEFAGNKKLPVSRNLLVSPNIQAALAYCIQLPDFCGKKINTVLLDIHPGKAGESDTIHKATGLLEKTGINYCLLVPGKREISGNKDIDIWIDSDDPGSAYLMVRIGYSIMQHSSRAKGKIRIYEIIQGNDESPYKKRHVALTTGWDLAYPENIIHIVANEEPNDQKKVISKYSNSASLTITGLHVVPVREIISGHNEPGDWLFVKGATTIIS